MTADDERDAAEALAAVMAVDLSEILQGLRAGDYLPAGLGALLDLQARLKKIEAQTPGARKVRLMARVEHCASLLNFDGVRRTVAEIEAGK